MIQAGNNEHKGTALVLTRKLDQLTIIGDPGDPENVTKVMVVEIRGDQIRLGINAPCDVVVGRKGIWMQKRQEKTKNEKLHLQKVGW